MKNYTKYKVGYFPPKADSWEWQKKDHIEKAPLWCSVDLRDGNQALVVPMTLDEKIEYFKYLVELGFKEIEVGFPAASDTEYELLRHLIEEDLIPDDVTIQVLTQSRDHIIEKTFESLKGAKKAIVHLYNSTSFAQRQQVFRASEDEIIEIAKNGAKKLLECVEKYPETDFRFQYSPESFTGTEMEFAVKICNEVIDILKPTAEKKLIINLPATVEMSMPHVHANQVEYMCKNLKDRENLIISLHPHNDRGTAVAAAELGVLAGADRVEGTLFGNGERTGNVDVITLAMNLFSHGIDPMLNFSNMPEVVEKYERFTDMKVNPRHPYSGQLVFAAFSGSHQDAIAKGMKWKEEKDPEHWTVPYLPIDPHDVGRKYDGAVIRINSQSGKGGVSYILEQNYGFNIPREMRPEIGELITSISDKNHEELSPEFIYGVFKDEYINDFSPLDITDATFGHVSSTKSEADNIINVKMRALINDVEYNLEAQGNGRLDAVSNALRKTEYHFNFKFVTYSEHAISADSNSKAAAYVCIADESGKQYWGVGVHGDIILASVNALVCALNRMNKNNHFVK